MLPARCRLPLISTMILVATLAGCVGDDDGPAERPRGITDQQGGQIELRMRRAQVGELLGEDPVLTAEPAKGSAGGCEFYAMSGRPLANVWKFCFDERDEATLGVTQYSPQQPEPPEEASPARAVLIARADAICQANYADLGGITRDAGKALRALDETESTTNRSAAGEEISKFVANLKDTHSMLSAFNAPDDELESFEGYLEALDSQAATLDDAADALIEGDEDTYDALGDEFNELARTAEAQARAYGFATCSAATFG